MSGTDSSAFERLDPRIQNFIWGEGWTELRAAQELAAPLILSADRDVIVAAATAAGKTEAAFLPALTHLLRDEANLGLIVYVSPLKALINDQFGRLERLCENLHVPVWPWHGDISSSAKARFIKKPSGVLLITPESLEALFCNKGTSVAAIFANLRFLVIDELHSFIGSERGKQMQSLLHRAELVIGRTVPRIGLSATLGDMALAADFLRPGRGRDVAMVEDPSASATLQLQIRGYEEPAMPERNTVHVVVETTEAVTASDGHGDATPQAPADDDEEDDDTAVAPGQIAAHLFKHLSGQNNLIFPNSRREVERYTRLLTVLCEKAKRPNEFWPHHGSLSKEIRTETEKALKQKEVPATAICTSTLELGIDIGAVQSVAQIGAPHSVASLRQRLGRSGRRAGESAVLRSYAIQGELCSRTSLDDALRLDTVRMTAMVTLLLEKWFEPPAANGQHLSTLVQQLLSLIAQNGGVQAKDAYRAMCSSGAPFSGLSPAEFLELLRHLGSKSLLMQDSSGLLLLGDVGERFVNHYSFYAAFAAEEEFRLICNGKPLGTLPVSQMLVTGQRILFAGKTWRVEDIQTSTKVISVSRTRGGAPPMFAGSGGAIHTVVHQRMRSLLSGTDVPAFLDKTATRFLAEARDSYRRLRLDERYLVDQGSTVSLFTWLGTSGNEALACILASHGFVAAAAGPTVEVTVGDRSIGELRDALAEATKAGMPALSSLLPSPEPLEREKWDWALPLPLLQKAFASLNLDLDEAVGWLQTLPTTDAALTDD